MLRRLFTASAVTVCMGLQSPELLLGPKGFESDTLASYEGSSRILTPRHLVSHFPGVF
jgi:hypothetical protein